MSFSKWTEEQKRKNQSMAASAQTAAPAPAAGSSAGEKPSSFSEWTRKNQGVADWRNAEPSRAIAAPVPPSASRLALQNLVETSPFNSFIRKNQLQQQREYERLSTLDLDATRSSFEDLQAQLKEAGAAKSAAPRIANEVDPYLAGDYLAGYKEDLTQRAAPYDDLSAQVAALRRDLQQAEGIQMASRYRSYLNEEDFAQYSAQGANIGYEGLYDPYFSVDDVPANALSLYRADGDPGRWGHITDDEESIYNYLLAKEGNQAAQDYLNYLTETVNYRSGTQQGKDVRGIENGLGRTLATGLYGVGAGLDRFVGGVLQLGSEERLPTSETQFGSAYIRDDLAETGPEILGSSLGQIGYDALTTTANMAPSILLSAATGGLGASAAIAQGVGAATLGASASGNAYNQARGEGHTKEEARSYAALVGVSEAGLQTLLGGISAFGGKVSGKTAELLTKNIQSGLGRAAASLGISMASEGMEEYLQEILEPAFRNIAFDEQNQMKLYTEEAAYSFLLGALTAGVLEGGGTISSEISYNKLGSTIQQSGQYDSLLENALSMDGKSEAHEMAARLQDGKLKTTNANVGELFALYARDGGDTSFMAAPEAAPETAAPAQEQSAQAGTVSNNMAERILADPDTVQALSEAAGLVIDPGMTKSQQRAAVKSALSSLSANEAAVSDTAAPVALSVAKPAVQPVTQAPVAEQVHQVRQVQRAADSLGESGAKALKASYDGSLPTDAYYAGFAPYYEAGISGLDMAKVNGQYIDRLSDAQKYAAYAAGQNDAAASLAAEREAVSTATVYGKEAGFVQTEQSARLPKQTVRLYNSLARATGVKIQMVEATGANGANGWYQNGTVYIAADAANPGEVVAKHEITHRMQELAPEAYRKYRDYVVRVRAEQFGEVASQVEWYKGKYAESGVNLTTEQAMDEIAADFTRELLLDPAQFEALAREDRSAAQKLLEALKDFIAKVKKVFRGDGKAQDMAVLEKAARLWSEALKETSQQVKAQKNTAREGGGARYSLNADFGRQFDAWMAETTAKDRLIAPGYFRIGTTSDALKNIGVRDSNIYWRKQKIGYILAEHSEMDISTIKAVPDLIERPVIIMKSKTQASSIVLLGDVTSANGDRVMVALELAPKRGGGMEANFSLLTSAYGRSEDNARRLVESSELLYLDPDKKRTDTWLMQLRVQFPSRQPVYGSIGTVSYQDGTVKIEGVPYQEYVQGNGENGNPKFSLKESEKIDGAALEQFGRTFYWAETGYLQKDGKRLDFSGKNDGAPGGYRTVDHREIWEAYDNIGLSDGLEGTDAMIDYMAQGNIRIIPESNGINLSALPTKAQEKALDDFIFKARGEVFLDIDDTNGDTVVSVEYPKGTKASKVLSDIRQYFKDGTQPYISEMSRYRYSLKSSVNLQREMAALAEENTLLRERVDYWKGQTRRTGQVTTDAKAVERAARDLVRDYGTDIEASEIVAELQGLYDYMASGRDGADELTYTEARRRAEEIGRRLVEDSVVIDDGAYREYADLRGFLRKEALTISEADSQNISDYSDFRKRNFGRMNLTKGETNIDRVYQELSERWPEFFDEQRESHPADQLVRISEVLESIYDMAEQNPFSQNMEQAAQMAANEVLETFFDLPQTKKTFADRQTAQLETAKSKGRQRVQELRDQKNARLAELRIQNRERVQELRDQKNARLAELRIQNRERVQEVIQKERVRRETQVEELKSRYRTRDAVGRERRSARELRARIVRHASALSQKLLRPSDKQHIPEPLRQTTAAMLEAINLESVYTYDPETGKRVKGGDGTPAKRTQAFQKLRLAYAEISKEGSAYTLIIDPDLAANLEAVEAMGDTPLGELSRDQLSTVWAAIRGVEASISTANKLLGQSRFETVSDLAGDLAQDNAGRADRGNYKGALGWLDKKVNIDMLTPQSYFQRLGETGSEIFRMLRKAQDRHIELMHDAQIETEKIRDGADVNKLEREVHTFEIGGEKLVMSTAQVMSLYELMKREQAVDHVLIGGIRPESIQTARGVRETRRAEPVRVSIEDVAKITDVLTDEQRKMADELQRYMGGKLAQLGNEASMEVYGYEKFNEPNYFPIQVDKNQTKKDIAKDAQAQTIAGRGFTKGVAPKANNALMVGSIFDVYAAHVNDMATYAAWLPTMENLRRIRDFTFRDSDGVRTGDVKTIIEKTLGKNGNPYLNKLLDDLNQGVKSSAMGGLDAIVGNYKAAAISANIRVILQQPTAILRALNTLDAKYLLEGTVKRGNWERVQKYAPIAVWKDWGYFDINTGRQMKDVLLSSDSFMEKVRQAGMAGAGQADSFAWARLWNAVEAETKDTRPGLKSGTDAFYRAVAERFSEIVDKTQVVDGILQRSQIMRSPDAIDKMATSFMGEPTKTFNMFTNAVYEATHAKGDEGRKAAKKALARTTSALLVSFAVNAVMQSIVDALRDDDKEKDYWEKMLQAYTGNFTANLNPLSYLPYAKDLISIFEGYDVTRMDMEAIERVWNAALNMQKALDGEGRYTFGGASANLFAEASRLLGLPVANLKRDVLAAVTTAAIETDNYLLQYRIDSALLNMGYSGNTKNFMDILYNARINDPEAYEIIYADMIARGMAEEKIRNGMEARMKRDQGVESVSELASRFLTPAQEKSYNSMRSQLSGTAVWRSASAAQRDSVEEDLYNLIVANNAGAGLQEKIDAGTPYGIDETDYLLYRLAQEMASEDGNNSTSQAEAQAAIDMLVGLSGDARAYLWQSTNKGWKETSNPYR